MKREERERSRKETSFFFEMKYLREEQHLLDGASPDVAAVRARGTLKSDGVLFLQNKPDFQNL